MKYFIFLIAVIISGCVKLLPDPVTPAQKIWFDSSSSSTEAKDHKRLPQVQLLIERPVLNTRLDSVKLSVIDKQNNIPVTTYLEGYELPDALSDMIQQNLLTYFMANQKFFSILPAEGNSAGTHKLKIILSDFTLFPKDSTSYIKIEGQLTLIECHTGIIKRQKYISYVIPIVQMNIINIRNGYSLAFDKLNQECDQFIMHYFN